MQVNRKGKLSKWMIFSVTHIYKMKEDEMNRVYADSVRSLADIASKHGTQAEIAASVLLSAYNSFEYKLCVTDLACLGDRLLCDAMHVILLRTQLDIEPHQLLDHGHEIFRHLQMKHGLYAKYHFNVPHDHKLKIVPSENECFENDEEMFAL